MYAVFRETSYLPGTKIEDTTAFIEFQDKHAKQAGYKGTVVTDAGEGHYLTVTLWEDEKAMNDARKELGPLVEKLLSPIMTSQAKLIGAGIVVINDIKEL